MYVGTSSLVVDRLPLPFKLLQMTRKRKILRLKSLRDATKVVPFFLFTLIKQLWASPPSRKIHDKIPSTTHYHSRPFYFSLSFRVSAARVPSSREFIGRGGGGEERKFLFVSPPLSPPLQKVEKKNRREVEGRRATLNRGPRRTEGGDSLTQLLAVPTTVEPA